MNVHVAAGSTDAANTQPSLNESIDQEQMIIMLAPQCLKIQVTLMVTGSKEIHSVSKERGVLPEIRLFFKACALR